MLLTLRALVQIPDITLSQDVLEFGNVQTGKAGVITLQLHNYKQARIVIIMRGERRTSVPFPPPSLVFVLPPTLSSHRVQVPCEWSVKCPVEASKCRDWAFFSLEPSEGVLEPGEKLNARVVFTPALGRELPYSQAFHIKITANPKSKEFVARGKGTTPKVVFDPPGPIDCGPILPMFEGQAPNESRLKMVNPCPYPIEVDPALLPTCPHVSHPLA